ncbi:MAG TPA: thioredoxin-disulfide reductase, partial [Candidatus Saccharimonadia bacterium]|nr:thioredoxin-disulfide reductase [Candidatus Saccharimonadia bacterium]
MDTLENVIIIGSGPSGWAAAVYLSRGLLKPLMFAGEKNGGQLMLTTDVENYPGFANGILGPELMAQMRGQAERFGTVVKDQNVTKVDFSSRPFTVWAGEEKYQAKAILIATGAESLMLGIPGEDRLLGRGVSTCAVCDAPFFKDKNTVVIGGGDSAMEDTLALTKFAASVTVIHRRDSFRASKIMQDRVLNHPKVKVMWNAGVLEIKGEQKVAGVTVQDLKTQQTQELPVEGVFLAIGHRPMTDLFVDQVKLNEKKYVTTRFALDAGSLALASAAVKEDLVAHPTMTSIEGVFAAGDVVDFRYRQAV